MRTYAHMNTYCTQALHAMKTGALVTDEMVLGIIADRIKEDDCKARDTQQPLRRPSDNIITRECPPPF